MTRASREIQKRPGLLRFTHSQKPRQQTVIDIGSNSVRLIVYQVTGRSIVQRLNEKVMAGLGENLSETGKLSEKGVESALKAIARFSAICASLGVTDVSAIATAAVRDAKDGKAFCEAAEENSDIKIRVLSGEEEALYAALGVVSAQRDPTGLIGDLGGSSLELISADAGELGKGKTYKLGPQALEGKSKLSVSKLSDFVKKQLRQGGAIPKAERFYGVGGAWRSIAALHMELKNYPLRVLQSYSVPAKEIIDLCETIADVKKRPDDLLASVSSKRAATLHFTALTLKCVLEECGAKEFITSAHGLREGIVYESLDPETQQFDPLLAGVATLAHTDQRQVAFSRALQNFLDEILSVLPPVFGDDAAHERRLHEAAFILADIGAMLHPDHRSDIAKQLVLRGPYTGINHVGRVYLGLITGLRYNRKHVVEELEQSVLTPEQIERAKTIALLIRVAAEFSGRTERILKRASIKAMGNQLVLTVQPRHKELVSEGVEKRLGHAASHMQLEPVIKC